MEHGGDAADLDAFDEFLGLESHDIHGHLAGRDLDVGVGERLADQVFQGGDALVLHDLAHHLG